MVFWEFWDPSLGDFLILKGPGQKQNFSLGLHSPPDSLWISTPG